MSEKTDGAAKTDEDPRRIRKAKRVNEDEDMIKILKMEIDIEKEGEVCLLPGYGREMSTAGET